MALLLAMCAVFSFFSPAARAQTLGVYLPTVYGDTAYKPLPIRLETPITLPPLKKKALELEAALEQARRPYIATIFAYANQSLVSRDFRLNTVTQGLEFGFYPNRQTQIALDFLPTIFGLHSPASAGFLYQGTIRSQLNDRFKYYATLGLMHTFYNVNPGLAVIGNVGASYAFNDHISLYGAYDRTIIGMSQLSAVGVNLPGTDTLVGRVKANFFSVGTNVHLTRRTTLNFRYGGGWVEGHNVKTNPFQEFNLRVGRTLIGREEGAHLQFLQPNFQFIASGFKYDESGFGNATLIPPATPDMAIAQMLASQAGIVGNPLPGQRGPMVGGYFSPQIFYLSMLRLDAGGRLFGNTYYQVGGGIGPQNFKDSTVNLGDTSLVAAANASITTRMSERITMQTSWYFIQANNNYQRNVIYNQIRYQF
jgi:hypothetical protein